MPSATFQLADQSGSLLWRIVYGPSQPGGFIEEGATPYSLPTSQIAVSSVNPVVSFYNPVVSFYIARFDQADPTGAEFLSSPVIQYVALDGSVYEVNETSGAVSVLTPGGTPLPDVPPRQRRGRDCHI